MATNNIEKRTLETRVKNHLGCVRDAYNELYLMQRPDDTEWASLKPAYFGVYWVRKHGVPGANLWELKLKYTTNIIDARIFGPVYITLEQLTGGREEHYYDDIPGDYEFYGPILPPAAQAQAQDSTATANEDITESKTLSELLKEQMDQNYDGYGKCLSY